MDRALICGPLRSSLLMRLRQVSVDEVAHVLPVRSEHAAGATARPIETERRDPSYDVRAAQVVRAARVAEAGATGIGVVRQEQREVADEARVDLYQVRMGDVTRPAGRVLPRRGGRERLLQ